MMYLHECENLKMICEKKNLPFDAVKRKDLTRKRKGHPMELLKKEDQKKG
jgi:hypothetical protein